jgi:hypothetical protein
VRFGMNCAPEISMENDVGQTLKMPHPNKDRLYRIARNRPSWRSRAAFSQRVVQLITFDKIPRETMSSRPADCASIGID